MITLSPTNNDLFSAVKGLIIYKYDVDIPKHVKQP